MIDQIIIIAAGVALLLLAEGVYYWVRYSGERRRATLRRRLNAGIQGVVRQLGKERRLARDPKLASLLAAVPFAPETEALLLQTDLSWTVVTVFGSSLALGLGLCIGSFMLMHKPASALAALLLGASAPFVYILRERGERSLRISEQLPDALDMIVRSLQAGHGLASGLKLVASEMPVPIAVEFARCFEEQQVGVDFRQAIENMTRRVGTNLDLRIFAVSVVIQQQTGGNLVEILTQIANTLRERFKFQGKVRALTAEGRVSAWIVGSLPFVTALIISFLNPGYLTPLIEEPFGHLMIASGAMLWIMGMAWLHLLAKVEY